MKHTPSRLALPLAVALLALGILAAGCSPEATRTRGGGPGADVGNRGRSVDLHASQPYGGMFYETPTQGQAIQTEGAAVNPASQAPRK